MFRLEGWLPHGPSSGSDTPRGGSSPSRASREARSPAPWTSPSPRVRPTPAAIPPRGGGARVEAGKQSVQLREPARQAVRQEPSIARHSDPYKERSLTKMKAKSAEKWLVNVELYRVRVFQFPLCKSDKSIAAMSKIQNIHQSPGRTSHQNPPYSRSSLFFHVSKSPPNQKTTSHHLVSTVLHLRRTSHRHSALCRGSAWRSRSAPPVFKPRWHRFVALSRLGTTSSAL